MDCRQFRKQHAYFIDDMLSGVETWAMRGHLSGCPSCARLDSQLRRSLLAARQAPALEVSTDFHRRLRARLAAERLANPHFLQEIRPARRRRMPVLAAAAALLAIGFGSVGILSQQADEQVTVNPVAVATPEAAPVAAAPVAVAATPAEPVHPAVLLAQRAAEQFAATQTRSASARATH